MKRRILNMNARYFASDLFLWRAHSSTDAIRETTGSDANKGQGHAKMQAGPGYRLSEMPSGFSVSYISFDDRSTYHDRRPTVRAD
jgi:hypothetical protein